MFSNLIRTPITQLRHNENSNQFFIKRDDLLPFSFGGNKVRIAEEYFKDMLQKDCNCIISYGSSKSNLNRVIANMSRAEGYHAMLFHLKILILKRKQHLTVY